jgi:lactoylglutathione lyase
LPPQRALPHNNRAGGEKELIMKSKFLHTNINVLDIDKSKAFYKEALGLTEVNRINADDGSFTIVFLGDGQTQYLLELTWVRDHKQPYDLGENEHHIAFKVEDKKTAYELHKKMGCICFENHDMDLYFISDPDGYWLEILDR